MREDTQGRQHFPPLPQVAKRHWPPQRASMTLHQMSAPVLILRSPSEYGKILSIGEFRSLSLLPPAKHSYFFFHGRSFYKGFKSRPKCPQYWYILSLSLSQLLHNRDILFLEIMQLMWIPCKPPKCILWTVFVTKIQVTCWRNQQGQCRSQASHAFVLNSYKCSAWIYWGVWASIWLYAPRKRTALNGTPPTLLCLQFHPTKNHAHIYQ